MQGKRIVLEATRGASLSVHSVAGLCTQHRKSAKSKGLSEAFAEAARLMRAAEGMCRSAVAVLENISNEPLPSGGVGGVVDNANNGTDVKMGGKGGTSFVARAAKRRKRRRGVAGGQGGSFGNQGGGGMDVDMVVPLASANSQSLVTPASLASLTQALNRTLDGRPLPASTSTSTTLQVEFGSQIKVQGLHSKPALNGCLGLVIGSVAADGRVPVKLYDSDSTLNVKTDNLLVMAPPLARPPA